MPNVEIDSLNNIADPFFPDDGNFRTAHYQNLFKNSVANKHTNGIMRASFNLGQYYNIKSKQLDSAVYYYDRNILLIEKLGISKWKNIISIIWPKGHLSRHFLSLESFEKTYKLSLGGEDAYEIIRQRLTLRSSTGYCRTTTRRLIWLLKC